MGSILATESLSGLHYFSADQVLSPYIYVFYSAYIVSLLFTPIMRSIASYYHVVDEPDGIRKMHRVPVAYLGGVAVFLGWLAGLATSQFLTLHYRADEATPHNLMINFSIVIGACAIILLGLWDDVLRMSPWKKITGQVAAAVCLLSADIGRQAAWRFMEPVLHRTNLYLHWPASDLSNHWIVYVVNVIFVVGVVLLCCNATNLMDGLDGLCGGVTAIIAVSFLFLAVSVATISGGVNANQDGLRVVLALALLGGVLGFVPFNFNPASIFMGDTGSMFLGFCCATMMILFASEGQLKWFLAAMVMFSLPLLDTALAFVRRWINGRPLFSPDRFHLHHQLVARGFTVKQTVVISYGLSLFFCLLGAAIVFIRTRYAVAVYLVVFGSIIVAAIKMGMVHEKVKAVARHTLTPKDAQMGKSVEPGAVLDVNEELPSVPAAADSLTPDSWAETAPHEQPVKQ